MYYAILPPEVTHIGGIYYEAPRMALHCPRGVETEEDAVNYLTRKGFKHFKLYERVDTLVGEYAPQEQPVVRKVVPTKQETANESDTEAN